MTNEVGRGGQVARRRDRSGAYRILMWKSEGQRPVGRSGRKLENIVKKKHVWTK
jgi:hypothetical protein